MEINTEDHARPCHGFFFILLQCLAFGTTGAEDFDLHDFFSFGVMSYF